MTEQIQTFFSLEIVYWGEALLRILLAAVFALVMGYDRKIKDKPIDYRAYMIVSVTTCMIAMLGQELYADYTGVEEVLIIDLSRIISGLMTGIGFLGAGAIIRRDENDVVGTATGASVWGSGGIGLALGFGHYFLATIAFLMIALILFLGGRFTRRD